MLSYRPNRLSLELWGHRRKESELRGRVPWVVDNFRRELSVIKQRTASLVRILQVQQSTGKLRSNQIISYLLLLKRTKLAYKVRNSRKIPPKWLNLPKFNLLEQIRGHWFADLPKRSQISRACKLSRQHSTLKIIRSQTKNSCSNQSPNRIHLWHTRWIISTVRHPQLNSISILRPRKVPAKVCWRWNRNRWCWLQVMKRQATI